METILREIEVEDDFMAAVRDLSADLAETELAEVLEILLSRGA